MRGDLDAYEHVARCYTTAAKNLSKICRPQQKFHTSERRESAGHTLPSLTKSKQKGPALKGVFCAPCGSSSLQYLWEYCCFVCRPNPSQNASFQGAKQSQAGRSLYCKGEIRTRSKAARGVEALACVLLVRAARFVFLNCIPCRF